MKKIILLIIAALIVVLSGCDNYTGSYGGAEDLSQYDSTDSGAYKPSIMYENVIYSISPYKTDTYAISDATLSLVGIVESVVNGTTLPQQNLQASGNTDLLNCNIYTVSARYPDHLIVLDKNDNYSVYIAERNERYMTLNDVRAIPEKFGENLAINDLRDFIGTDIGSGLHIPQFPIDNGEYYLTVGAGGTDGPVLYVYLSRSKDDFVNDGIDIRYYDVDKFVADGTQELIRPLPEQHEALFANGNSTGGAIVITIRAEVIEVISNRALRVKVIEPDIIFDNNENLLLPGVFVNVIYGDDIDWISDVIENMVDTGTIIEFGRGITIGVPDFLQEPLEIRGSYNIRIFDEDDNNIFEQGF